MENLVNEIWKDIPDYEGLYEGSNFGRVRNSKGCILKTGISKSGYSIVWLCKNSKYRAFNVHKLIWVTFNGEVPEGYDVNHINENKLDSNLFNLEIIPHRDNCNYGKRNQIISDKMTNGKLSKAVYQYDLEGNLIKIWPSGKEIVRQLNYNRGNVCGCCRGERKTAYGYIWSYSPR